MFWKWTKRIATLIFIVLFAIILLTNSGKPSLNFDELVRYSTRQIEFDYVNWTIQAIYQKLSQAALGTGRYLDHEQQIQVLDRFFAIVDEQSKIKDKIIEIYASPAETSPDKTAQPLLVRQKSLQEEQKHISLLVESILQQQISSILSESNLDDFGQPVPPVQYHTSALPFALIISPRNVIRQDSNISLLPDLTLDQIVALEKSVENRLDISALVVPVGGIGVYPTMVMETTDLSWLAEVVAHEWIHNFLTLRPLGILYDTTPELRTINETTASIAGVEIGEQMINRYYTALVKPKEEPGSSKDDLIPPQTNKEPVFDYRAAMHETRVTADALLAKGKIQEAEDYMETRRLVFIKNGYNIRKLNQAYFAFYGAYADTPGGAAGEDPVGAAVRSLRAQSDSLSQFIHKISRVTSFEKLQELLNIP